MEVTMSIEKLMIGDFVFCHHPTQSQEIVKVTSGLLSILERQKNGIINNSSPLYRIVKPIPITEEILKKNGFFGQEYGEIIIGEWRIMCDCFNVAILHNEHVDIDIPICYVHELQHALRMCNIDKEIEL